MLRSGQETQPNTDYLLFPEGFKPNFSKIKPAALRYEDREIFRHNTQFMGAKISFLLRAALPDYNPKDSIPQQPLGSVRVAIRPYDQVIEELPLSLATQTEANRKQYEELRRWSIKVSIGKSEVYYRVAGDEYGWNIDDLQNYGVNQLETMVDCYPKSSTGRPREFFIPAETDRWNEIKYRFTKRAIPSIFRD